MTKWDVLRLRATHQSESVVPRPPDAAELHANFLALRQRFQALEAENADWNRKKTLLKKPRRWSKKRLLAAAKVKRPSGAQQGNTNRLKHGKYSRDWQLFLALIRTHIQAGRALVACAAAESNKCSA